MVQDARQTSPTRQLTILDSRLQPDASPLVMSPQATTALGIAPVCVAFSSTEALDVGQPRPAGLSSTKHRLEAKRWKASYASESMGEKTRLTLHV